MKIAQINTVFGQGSTGRIVQDIHNLLIENGHVSKVFYGRGPISDDANVVKFSNNFAVYKDVLWTRLFNRHSESDHHNTLALIDMLKKFSPDVIHIHNIHGYYLNYELLFNFFSTTNIPIVWLLHDQWPLSGCAAYFENEKIDWKNPNIRELKCLSKEYPNHWFPGKSSSKRVFKRKEHYFKLDNLTIVTPSEWLAKIVRNSFLGENKIKVINNGIDLSKFKYYPNHQKNQIANNQKQLLGVASVWDNRKGLSYFIKLAKELDESYQITLVGVNEKQKENLPRNINIVNKTQSIEELAKIYSKSDILINPTLQDNFPTVNLEAQACGTPVITFDTGGSPESIINGKTGAIVAKGDFKQLKNTILNWKKKDLDIIQDCILNSKKYSRENSIIKYLQLYENLISS